MPKDKLTCPHCRTLWSISQILNYSDVSWPQQSWVYFHCPTCLKGSHVELSGSTISIGDLDGGPGPCFLSSDSTQSAELSCTKSGNGLKIHYAGREWFIAAKK